MSLFALSEQEHGQLRFQMHQTGRNAQILGNRRNSGPSRPTRL